MGFTQWPQIAPLRDRGDRRRGLVQRIGATARCIGPIRPSRRNLSKLGDSPGIGIIRHVWVTRNKDLLIHQSSSNRIGRIKVIEDQTEAVTVEETDTAGG